MTPFWVSWPTERAGRDWPAAEEHLAAIGAERVPFEVAYLVETVASAAADAFAADAARNKSR